MHWFLYIVKCKDGSLYTGVTTDLKRRVHEHNNSNKAGARSLRGKRPVKLVYSEKAECQKEALQRECVIKSWSREYKIKLIEGKF